MSSNLSAASLFSVPGLVAVITGGGTGIGLMMAKALALNGAAKVYILGRRLEKLQEAAKVSHHGNIIPLQCDVTSKPALAAAAAQVERETGYINLLCANSGISGPLMSGLKAEPSLKEFKDYCWNMDADEYTKVFQVNDTAVFFTVMAFLELMDAGNKKGNTPEISSQIIVTASVASYLRLVTTGFAYVSSKAAVLSLTKALATMLAPYEIRANAIAPGLYPSELTEDYVKHVMEGGGIPKKYTPAARAGTEEDMVGTTLYLASRAGAFCDGNIVVTDGGRLSVVPSTY